jgi:phage tail sheath protein FI
MPEYLSPGVYVEEIDTGSKPIEGVSTSTAGMVGCCERGPLVPVLVTSFGEFQRLYGGLLPVAEFTDAAGGVHAYLPHGVQGFFTNGGRRVHVVRVVAPDAARASLMLHDRGAPGAAATRLLRAAPQGSGMAVAPPLLYVLDTSDLAIGETVRVGDGSRSEYAGVANVTAADAHVALSAPFAAAYTVADELIALDNAFGGFTLAADAAAGATVLTLVEVNAGDAAALLAVADPVFLEIRAGDGVRRFVAATALVANGGDVDVTLAEPLAVALTAAAAAVDAMAVPAAPAAADLTAPSLPIAAGDALVFPANAAAFAAPAVWIAARGGACTEVRRIGTFGVVSLDLATYADYPLGSTVAPVTLAAGGPVVAAGPAVGSFPVDDASTLEPGMTLSVDSVTLDNAGEPVRILSISANTVTLVADLAAVPAVGGLVAPSSTLTAEAGAGSLVLSLANRQGLAAGDVLRIGAAPGEEYATIARISGERGPTPDAGTLVLDAPLAGTHPVGAEVLRMAAPSPVAGRPVVQLAMSADAGATDLYLNDETGFAANDLVQVITPSGASFLHRLVADAVTVSAGTVELDRVLGFSNAVGAPLVERAALLDVVALDTGAAGNRLRIAVADAEPPLVQTELTQVVAAQVIELASYTNVEAGTLIELLDPDTGAAVGTPLKVRRVDRAAGEVELDPPGLTPAQQAAHAAAQLAGLTLTLRSRELLLSVFLVQRPDPAIPSRNDTVIDGERFLVTMDSRHSRYVHRVIGTTWDPAIDPDRDDDGNPLRLWDRRSEGESAYIRVRDIAAGNAAVTESVRLGPEPLVDLLDTGRTQAARLPLTRGTDAIETLSQVSAAQMYRGVDHDEPVLRRGIPALRNVEEIAIVAVPGQTATTVQQALINHCEAERYRFAVLDCQGPNRDTVADVLALRQRYDTRYAALYYPWLTVPEPRPVNVTDIRQLAIPPSGHVIGIYARVDNTRGVHKAPANEVVRGITGLTRKINQREHDVLNPVGIDALRDFRDGNRGLRVWGARCITSDSDWKYVNVRRLLIFIEASIDRGLQWAVFEPNAEPLWARVRRAITNFLTVVWRNGALEGTSVEQAFFVKCDRTTMTQTDIDNGRLICVIGVAPVKPAEFVIIRIGLWTADAEQ